MQKSDYRKIIHDLNSGLSTVAQSLDILCSDEDAVLAQELHPLCKQKMEEIINNWELLKQHLNQELL